VTRHVVTVNTRLSVRFVQIPNLQIPVFPTCRQPATVRRKREGSNKRLAPMTDEVAPPVLLVAHMHGCAPTAQVGAIGSGQAATGGAIRQRQRPMLEPAAHTVSLYEFARRKVPPRFIMGIVGKSRLKDAANRSALDGDPHRRVKYGSSAESVGSGIQEPRCLCVFGRMQG
jgi:hypothetical protein